LSRDKDGFGVEYFIQTDAAITRATAAAGLKTFAEAWMDKNTQLPPAPEHNWLRLCNTGRPRKTVAEDLINTAIQPRIYRGDDSSVNENISKCSGLEDVKGAVVNKVIKGKAAAKAVLKWATSYSR
jgi:hypothetical protein